MKISQNTRISDLIKMNKDVIEALASINKHFEKLRNPILRRVLAPRVTIADAAKIGGTNVEAFFEKLKPLGFDCEHTESIKEVGIVKPPAEISFEPAKLIEFDVRGILASGGDPLNAIMQELDKMPKEHTLKIINTFEPIPLIKVLQRKGYVHFTEKNGEVVNTYFAFANNKPITEVEINTSDSSNFQEVLKKYEGKLTETDVRQLEMPQPMIKILKELETLPTGKALFVHHKKVPQYLLPELAEKGFAWCIKEVSEGNVQLLIFKQ